MRLTSSGAYARPPPVPKMPAGLVELMEDLTRNVLRHNPANVYEFCAGHMEKLLEIRDGRAPKQVLTLEQKIARVQDKMNKKADLRRKKYDMQIKLYRLNSKTTSKQRDDQMRPLNDVEDELTNTSETRSNQDDNPTPQSNIAENQSKDSIETSPDQELVKKNNAEEIVLNDAEKIKINETDLDQDNDKNILAETKDVEQHQGEDVQMQNKSKEWVPINKVELKAGPDEVQNKFKYSMEKTLEQDVEISNELKDPASLILIENKNAFSHCVKDNPKKSTENNSDIDKVKQTETEESVLVNVVKDEIGHLDVPEESKDSTETSLQDVFETKIQKDQFIEENIAQDQTVIFNTVEDESKAPNPVHHEQDLVDDLEVEIFHEPSESKKASKESADTQEFNEGESYTKTTEDKNNEEYSANDNSLFDQNDLPLNRKDEENSPEIKPITNLKSPSVDNVKSEIEIGNNTPSISETSETLAGSHENTSDVKSKINHLSGSASEYKPNSGIPEVFGVDNEGKLMTEEVFPLADERVKEPHDNITYTVLPTEIYTEENVIDVKDKLPSGSGVFEIPMQKKKYALLLPEISTEDEAEPGKLKNEINEKTISSESKDTVDITTDQHISKDNNIVTNTEDSADIIESDVAQSADINKEDSSIDDVQTIKSTNKFQEKNKDLDDDTENKVIENGVGNNVGSHIEFSAEIKENKNENKEEEIIKLPNDKHNEITTSSNYDSKTELETEKLNERLGESEGNISSNSEITQKTETTVNDSADESTVGDSNDSLMEHDVESIIRSEENIKNSSTMDLETAAITIQKVFRTFLFKSRCSTFEDTSTDEANPITDDDNEKEEFEYPVTKERRPLGISRMDTVLQTVNEEKSLSLSTDDSSTLSSAATVIQAHVRGFLARKKYESHKTTSDASLVNSDGFPTQSFEADEKQKKTVLNIHIVPEGDHFLSRDESLITSMDLSLDGTPPSSVNLHPLGYDKSEPRKQLKREDAIQSISPPSNNSGKLSEDVDSVKEIMINDIADDPINVSLANTDMDSDSSPTKSNTLDTVVETTKSVESSASTEPEIGVQTNRTEIILTKMSSDEGDVVTPFEQDSPIESDRTSCLLHSGEFHDIVLPTKVIRSDTSVVRGE